MSSLVVHTENKKERFGAEFRVRVLRVSSPGTGRVWKISVYAPSSRLRFRDDVSDIGMFPTSDRAVYKITRSVMFRPSDEIY